MSKSGKRKGKERKKRKKKRRKEITLDSCMNACISVLIYVDPLESCRSVILICFSYRSSHKLVLLK